MLIGIPFRLINLVEVDFLQIRLDQIAIFPFDMYVMFVRWITAPVTTGCIHFHQYVSMYRRSRWQQIIDLTTHVVTSADGDGDLLWLNEPGFMVFIGGNPGDDKFSIALGRDGKFSVTWQIQGCCRTRPYILSLKIVPSSARRIDRNRPSEKNDRQLVFTADKRPLIICFQSSGVKRDKIPPCRLWRDSQDQIRILWIGRRADEQIISCILHNA